MSREHPTLRIRRGDSLQSVQKILGLTVSPEIESDDGEEMRFYHLADLGFWVFFDDSAQVYSIRIDPPYLYAVEGVRIGDTKDKVLSVRGKPHRYFPVQDGTDRWLYDRPSFFRVDFNPDTDCVENIFR